MSVLHHIERAIAAHEAGHKNLTADHLVMALVAASAQACEIIRLKEQGEMLRDAARRGRWMEEWDQLAMDIQEALDATEPEPKP